MTNIPQFVYIETNGNGLKSLVALSFNICLIGDNPEACTNANAANGKFDSTVTPIGEIAYPAGVREAGASVAAALAANTTCDGLISLSFLSFCCVDIEQRCVFDRDFFNCIAGDTEGNLHVMLNLRRAAIVVSELNENKNIAQ